MPRCYEGYQLRGEAWAHFGRLEKFEDDFEFACRLRPADPMLLGRRANCYSDLGKFDQAIEVYMRVLQLDPNTFAWHNNLGLALKQAKRYDDAIEAFQRALELVRDFDVARRSIEEQITECRYRLQATR